MNLTVLVRGLFVSLLPPDPCEGAEQAVLYELANLPAGLPVTEQALAVVLARYLDAASKQIGTAGPAPVSRGIVELMDRLRAAAEERSGRGDVVDGLAAKRVARREAAAKAVSGE